jgi:hypothetical protein
LLDAIAQAVLPITSVHFHFCSLSLLFTFTSVHFSLLRVEAMIAYSMIHLSRTSLIVRKPHPAALLLDDLLPDKIIILMVRLICSIFLINLSLQPAFSMSSKMIESATIYGLSGRLVFTQF